MGEDYRSRLPISSEDLRQRRAEIAAMVARLLSHYWTAAEPAGVRQAQAEDWIEDLSEFLPSHVAEACRRWRRTQSRKPTIADIRALAIEEREIMRSSIPVPAEVEGLIDEIARFSAKHNLGHIHRPMWTNRSPEELRAWLARWQAKVGDTIAGEPWR